MNLSTPVMLSYKALMDGWIAGRQYSECGSYDVEYCVLECCLHY